LSLGAAFVQKANQGERGRIKGNIKGLRGFCLVNLQTLGKGDFCQMCRRTWDNETANK